MINRSISFVLGLIALSISSFAQKVVTRNDTVEVFHGSNKLKLPWASGLNAAQISEIDFNYDGKMDLFVFEPNNGANIDIQCKILPLINQGTPDSVDYKFVPNYRDAFPVMEVGAMLRDYNCDGKADIFTINAPFQTMKIFRNDGGTPMQFTLVKDPVLTDTSDYPPNFMYSNEVYWNQDDYPSVTDIDGDGDLDILSVDRYGFFVEYHKNLSKETYGHCDSLIFKVKSACWGRFMEDFGMVVLDTCHGYNVANPEKFRTPRIPGSSHSKGAKHSNTSLMALDLNGDGVMDLLSGDGNRSQLYSYINAGTKTSSKMGMYTNTYPATNPYDAFIYGIPSYVETNNDNKKDLIVSVKFDDLQDVKSLWRYKNLGSNSLPNFVLDTKSFLQEDMIDIGTRSRPVFYDYDGDSLLDLLVGGYGTQVTYGFPFSTYRSGLAYYKNTGGLQSPRFELVTLDLDSMSNLKLDSTNNKTTYGYHPTFGDLDGDGDQDMLIGDFEGKIHYFRNDAIGTQSKFNLVTREFQGIDVGEDATPFLFDIDNDLVLDLFVGNRIGDVAYYAGLYSSEPDFDLQTTTFGNINLGSDYWNKGHVVPFLFRDTLDNVRMIVGTRSGFINYYDSIRVNGTIQNDFHLVEASYQNMWDGFMSSVYGADLNNDNSLDFVLGNQSGGVTLYTSEDSIYIPGIEDYDIHQLSLNLFPNPTDGELYMEVLHAGNSPVTYTVYNVLGRAMTTIRAAGRIKIDVSAYSEGLYFVRAENKNRSINLTERFIKSR